jgi:hypothetical protein
MPTLKEGTIKRIHVNMHVIRYNNKTGERCSVITMQHGKKPMRVKGIKILGPSSVIYSPDKPLSCGARVWVETTAAVEYEEATDDYQQVQASTQDNRSRTRECDGSECTL